MQVDRPLRGRSSERRLFGVRLSEPERRAVERRAKAAGLPASTWARRELVALALSGGTIVIPGKTGGR